MNITFLNPDYSIKKSISTEYRLNVVTAVLKDAINRVRRKYESKWINMEIISTFEQFYDHKQWSCQKRKKHDRKKLTCKFRRRFRRAESPQLNGPHRLEPANVAPDNPNKFRLANDRFSSLYSITGDPSDVAAFFLIRRPYCTGNSICWHLENHGWENKGCAGCGWNIEQRLCNEVIAAAERVLCDSRRHRGRPRRAPHLPEESVVDKFRDYYWSNLRRGRQIRDWSIPAPAPKPRNLFARVQDRARAIADRVLYGSFEKM